MVLNVWEVMKASQSINLINKSDNANNKAYKKSHKCECKDVKYSISNPNIEFNIVNNRLTNITK